MVLGYSGEIVMRVHNLQGEKRTRDLRVRGVMRERKYFAREHQPEMCGNSAEIRLPLLGTEPFDILSLESLF